MPAHERRIERELAPADHALVEEMHHDEEHVDHYNDKHLLYELAEVALEVGIVLATVSIIAHRRWLLGTGAAVGVVGALLLVVGALTVWLGAATAVHEGFTRESSQVREQIHPSRAPRMLMGRKLVYMASFRPINIGLSCAGPVP
jgi:hypothetical protein